MNKEIYVLGIGHNSPVYFDLVQAAGYTIRGLYHYNDERTGEIDHGFEILGSFNDLFALGSLEGMNFALSQGDNKIRATLFEQIKALGGNIPTIVHPSAIISPSAQLGEGVIIHINAIIHPDTKLGKNTVISANSNIIHNAELGSNCYVAAGSTVGAYTLIEDFVFVGMGSVLISAKVPYVKSHAYIGAGSLVTKTIEGYTVVAGRPAKVIKVLSQE